MNKKQRKDELLEEKEEEEYDVPTDICIEILSRVPLLTLLGARLVCPAWNDIITHWQSHHPYHYHRNLTPAALLSYPCIQRPRRPSGSKFPAPPPPTKTYQTLVDLPSGQHQRQRRRTFGPLQIKGVVQPRTLHESRKYLPPPFPFDYLLIPEASCHGLVCFSVGSSLHRIFVGNPLLNDDFLMVPGSKTNLRTAEMEAENKWNNPEVSHYLVGFGFSPKINSYKIMQFMRLIYRPPQRPTSILGAFEIFTICNSSDEESPSSWRSLGSFPPQFSNETTKKNPLGSYLKGSIHWLFRDAADGSIFISRLDLDTEEFGRLPMPQASNFTTNGELNFEGMSLGVSDGYLNVCANLFGELCDIWVMKEYNSSWTKQFVVRSPVTVVPPQPRPWVTVDPNPRVQLLNYAAAAEAEDSTGGGTHHTCKWRHVVLIHSACGLHYVGNDIFGSVDFSGMNFGCVYHHCLGAGLDHEVICPGISGELRCWMNGAGTKPP